MFKNNLFVMVFIPVGSILAATLGVGLQFALEKFVITCDCAESFSERGRDTLKARKTTLLTLGVASLVTVLFFLLQGPIQSAILQEWYLHKLGSENSYERKKAAVRLAGLRSVRAIPLLVRMGRKQIENSSGHLSYWIPQALVEIGPEGVSALPSFRFGEEIHPNVFHALEEMGPEAVGAIPFLIEIPDDARVLSILDEMGPRAKEAIPYLIVRLSDEANGAHAAAILSKIGREAIPPLLEALGESKEQTRLNAALALGKLRANEAVISLSRSLTDPSIWVRIHAAGALGEIGTEAVEAIPALLRTLEDKDRRLSGTSAVALGSIGKAAAPAIPSLLYALLERDLVPEAAHALQEIDPEGTLTIPELVRASKSDLTTRRECAVWTIGLYGGRISGVVPALLDALRDKVPAVRFTAAASLTEMKCCENETVPVLVELLKESDSVVRGEVTRLLKKISESPEKRMSADPLSGKTAPPYLSKIPNLLTALNDGDPEVRRRAFIAIGKIGPPAEAAVPALIQKLGDTSWGTETPKMAAEALSYIGAIAVPPLVEALESDDAHQRAECIRALSGITGREEIKIPAIVKSLEDPEEEVRRMAIWALGELGSKAGPAVPALTGFLEDPDLSIQILASNALFKVTGQAKRVMPVLLKGLVDPNLRFWVFQVLGTMGQKAREAVPVLIKFLREDDLYLIQESILVLEKIGPDARPAIPQLKELLELTYNSSLRATIESALKEIQRAGP